MGMLKRLHFAGTFVDTEAKKAQSSSFETCTLSPPEGEQLIHKLCSEVDGVGYSGEPQGRVQGPGECLGGVEFK